MDNFLFDEDLVSELNQNIKNLRATMEETIAVNGQQNYAQYEDLMGHLKKEVNRIDLFNQDVQEMNARFKKQLEI
ncbi:hypothetical protein [Carnobacterium divergens]|uniref:hypothetical protein n=1 Tax=Carnobacterium divergens TaxID=2748 RepID=UPI00288F18A2|nr:hypothetical protein [Carnobacterium divergens]MDT2010807.1 hypothetical protein [Carnobacterium divergens]